MNEFKEIRGKLDIIDVAKDLGLQLDHNDMCCCPFHSERTQSMKLYGKGNGDNKFYCFGCGASGDVIDLTSRLYNIPMREAAKKLNSDYSLGIMFGGRDSSVHRKSQVSPEPPKSKPPPVISQTGHEANSTSKKQWEQWELLRSHEYLSKERKKLAVKFIYRKPDGSKIASWRRYEGDTLMKGLNGLKMPLYHVYNMTDNKKPVFLVEGEKDVETLERLGFTATTSPNGAGSRWLSEYSNEFQDFDVIILADNDDVGLSHAKEAAESISRTARTVKLVPSKMLYEQLQPKGDISDIYSLVGSEQTVKLLSDVIKFDSYIYSAKSYAETVKEQRWLNSALIVAENYLKILDRWKNKLKPALSDAQQSELYLEAVRNRDTVKHFVDTLSGGSEKEKHEIYTLYKSDIEKIALRLKEIRQKKLEMTLLPMSEMVSSASITQQDEKKINVKGMKKNARR